MKAIKQEFTYASMKCTIVDGTRRLVPGGSVIDIRLNDPRTTCTYTTVPVEQVRDQQGQPYSYH